MITKLENGNFQASKLDLIKMLRSCTQPQMGLLEAKIAVDDFLLAETFDWNSKAKINDVVKLSADNPTLKAVIIRMIQDNKII